jgi:hypothetical protein
MSAGLESIRTQSQLASESIRSRFGVGEESLKLRFGHREDSLVHSASLSPCAESSRQSLEPLQVDQEDQAVTCSPRSDLLTTSNSSSIKSLSSAHQLDHLLLDTSNLLRSAGELDFTAGGMDAGLQQQNTTASCQSCLVCSRTDFA